MKEDYKHESMNQTIILRCYPRMKEDLEQLLKDYPERFNNISHAAKAAIQHSLYCEKFLHIKKYQGLKAK